MLKRNWNWRNCKHFCHRWNFFWRGGFPGTPPPAGCANAPIEENKKGVRKFSARFLAFSNKISTVQKIVLSSSRGQGNFWGLEASRPRTWPSRPKPRTSKRVLEDVLEAKDVLEDSTSGTKWLWIKFFNWFSNVKNLVLSNGSEHVQNAIQCN